MPVFDKELMFRTTGTLTNSQSIGPLVVYGCPIEGYAVRVNVPSANGINDTIYPKVWISADNSTYNLFSLYALGASKPGTTGLDMIVPLVLPNSKWYVKLELAVVIASITATFGTVQAGIVLPVGKDWNRKTSWT